MACRLVWQIYTEHKRNFDWSINTKNYAKIVKCPKYTRKRFDIRYKIKSDVIKKPDNKDYA